MCSCAVIVMSGPISSSSVSSSVSSASGSICDVWGVAYPSDFIPGGGQFKTLNHFHRHYQQQPHQLAARY